MLFRNATSAVAHPAGATIFKEGDPGDVMYVVQEGELQILVRGQAVETLGPGSIVGEMALVDSVPRSASLVAKTDCRVVPVDKKQFTYLIQQTPFFALQVMQIMADRLRKLNARLAPGAGS